MGLPEVILEIAADMEKEYAGGQLSSGSLLSYVKQLRMAVKAAGPSPGATGHLIVGASAMESQIKEAAKARERLARRTEAEEGLGTGYTILVGGQLDGDTAPVDPGMPVGAYVAVGKEVYQLQSDGKLHFNQEATAKYKK